MERKDSVSSSLSSTTPKRFCPRAVESRRTTEEAMRKSLMEKTSDEASKASTSKILEERY
jgi:hypothetical protein